MGKGSFPLHRQALRLPPAQTYAAAEVLGRYNFILKHLSLAGGVHPSAALLPSHSAAVTEAMEEGWGERQRKKPVKEK